MSNLDDLRATLFEAMAAVKSGTMDLDKARAINEIGKTIVDTAKVEVAYINATGKGKSTFIPVSTASGPALPAQPPGNGIGSVVQQLGGEQG